MKRVHPTDLITDLSRLKGTIESNTATSSKKLVVSRASLLGIKCIATSKKLLVRETIIPTVCAVAPSGHLNRSSRAPGLEGVLFGGSDSQQYARTKIRLDQNI